MRHPNGGAEKVGLDVHVSADSLCNQDSVIDGRSNVLHSTLLWAFLTDCQVFNSRLDLVGAQNTIVSQSSILNAVLTNAVVDNVMILGGTNGVLDKFVRLVDVVAENCELRGQWKLEGNARIPCGVWHRAPRFCRITGENGVDVGLTESTDGHALMACWRKPIQSWLQAGPRLGRKHRWTEKQILTAQDFFTELLDVPLEGVSA